MTDQLKAIRYALILGKVDTERLAGVIPQVFSDEDTADYVREVQQRARIINEALSTIDALIMASIRTETNSWTNSSAQ